MGAGRVSGGQDRDCFRQSLVCDFKDFREQDIPFWEWEGLQHQFAVMDLWLPRTILRIVAISKGAKRHWNKVASEASDACHWYQPAGPPNRHHVQHFERHCDTTSSMSSD